MLRVLRNALADMTISIPNCTSLATQAQQSQIKAHLEKEDPMKLLISQCNLFNSSSIHIQDTYVKMNTQLKGQLETKNEIINHQANENKELVKSLEGRKQLANIQSESIQLLTAEVDLLIPNDLTRTRVRRNLDGTIKSANLCQCVPEAPGASLLELSSIQLTCPNDMTILRNNSKIDQIVSLPCSDSVCSVEKSSWPQCEDILQKAWYPWVYVNCSQIAIGNQTIQCGSGERLRSREVRSSSKDPWRREAVSEPCQQCTISQGHTVTILPPALATALNESLEILDPGCLDGWSQFQNSCYFMFKSAKTRSSASTHCQSYTFKAELASIHSEEENNFLNDMVKSISGSYIHIGGSDERTEGQWEWSDGSNWNYENWIDGQPDGGAAQNALMMDKSSGKWRDLETSATHPYICKV